jgi:hypothetical protein
VNLLRPILIDGHVIHLRKQTLGVAETCSGIRSRVSLLSVAVGWVQNVDEVTIARFVVIS